MSFVQMKQQGDKLKQTQHHARFQVSKTTPERSSTIKPSLVEIGATV
jgi:hypothetical protein